MKNVSVSLRTEIGKILFAELPDKRHEFCDYLAGRISALIGKCESKETTGSFTVNWKKEGVGFGQFIFTQKGETLHIDNEYMGKEFIKGIMNEVIDNATLKNATPTFSGGENKKEKCLCDTCQGYSDCWISFECKPDNRISCSAYKPTEQKECICGKTLNSNLLCPIHKPIPAEKKEEKRFGDICLNCGCEKILHNCPECGMKQPEPKPKDRIEELNTLTEKSGEGRFMRGNMNTIINKLNELIRHINKEE
jgi:hypothetical protein